MFFVTSHANTCVPTSVIEEFHLENQYLSLFFMTSFSTKPVSYNVTEEFHLENRYVSLFFMTSCQNSRECARVRARMCAPILSPRAMPCYDMLHWTILVNYCRKHVSACLLLCHYMFLIFMIRRQVSMIGTTNGSDSLWESYIRHEIHSAWRVWYGSMRHCIE